MPDTKLIKEETHLRVLRLLESQPDISQRELADILGVSLGKVNYCIRALLEKGHIKANNFRSSQHKIRYVYLLTPAGLVEKAELTARFLKVKIEEYENLKLEIDALKKELITTERHDGTQCRSSRKTR
ncbi:MAG TPA: MarR family EPS-associated transcriptional regulator [Methanosarcina sp.]|nr:MarR family EPS-associated transcriptional regulator [Methanosarcina sp.]